MNRIVPPSLVVAVLALPGGASACPDCDVSRSARSTVLHDPDLISNLSLMILPVAIIIAIAALVYRVDRGTGATSRAGGSR